MSLIDTTYFVNDLNVPLSSNTTLNAVFTQAIARYEDEILKDLLGYALWREFTDAVASESPLAQKWVDLKDGAEFSFEFGGNTINTKWNGLVNSDKKSLIAYYIYYQHRVNTDSDYTSLGQSRSKSENSVMVNPLPKMVQVYNSMVSLYGAIPASSRKYKSFLNNANYIHYNADPSAYNFLLANRATYSNWVFKPKGKVNVWGI